MTGVGLYYNTKQTVVELWVIYTKMTNVRLSVCVCVPVLTSILVKEVKSIRLIYYRKSFIILIICFTNNLLTFVEVVFKDC